jgi:hypothetical protein
MEMNSDKDKELNGNVSGSNNKKKSYKKKPFIKNDSEKKVVNKPFLKKVTETPSETITKRNKLLVNFFKLIGLPVRVIGDETYPDMVYNEEVTLNAFVNNFELNFTDAPKSKNVIYTVKLNENPRFDKNKILSCISDYPSRAIYKVAIKTTPTLYLSGYNFLNKEEKQGRYPVFSSYNPKIYFTEEKAKEIINELIQDGYGAVLE